MTFRNLRELVERQYVLDANRSLLYDAGWRVSEARNLTWANVDRDAATIRLSASETKRKKDRVFPYGEAPSLAALLEARWESRDGLHVFHRGGKPIRSFRRSWARACKRAGLAGRLVHDLRRSAARAFRRAGLSESDIMGACGWESPAMVRRYCGEDELHLGAQIGKRFNGKTTGKLETPATSSAPLSCSAASSSR